MLNFDTVTLPSSREYESCLACLHLLSFVVVKDIVQKKKKHSVAEVEKSISLFFLFFLFFYFFIFFAQ